MTSKYIHICIYIYIQGMPYQSVCDYGAFRSVSSIMICIWLLWDIPVVLQPLSFTINHDERPRPRPPCHVTERQAGPHLARLGRQVKIWQTWIGFERVFATVFRQRYIKGRENTSLLTCSLAHLQRVPRLKWDVEVAIDGKCPVRFCPSFTGNWSFCCERAVWFFQVVCASILPELIEAIQ